MWILAQQGEGEGPIDSEPVTEQGRTETMTVAADSNAAAQQAPARKSPMMYNYLLIGLMFVVMYFILFRGPRKKQQQHRKMVQTLKKNDRVRTIGGIIGTVVDVKDDEITLKVDESNNTKIKVASSAIGRNVSQAD